MNYLSNAFSLQMLQSYPSTIKVEEIEAPNVNEYVSVVGHADTAAVLGVKFNRVSVKLDKGDTLVVAQIVGGRLPEGATTIPPNFSFKWLKVTIG